MVDGLFVDGKPATALEWLKMMRERDKHESLTTMSHYTLGRLIGEITDLEKRLAFYEQHTSKQANELVAQKLVSQEHFDYYLRESTVVAVLRGVLHRIGHGMDLRFAQAKDMADIARDALQRTAKSPQSDDAVDP